MGFTHETKITIPKVDEPLVYLRAAAQQLGWECDGVTLYRFPRWWPLFLSYGTKCLSYTFDSEPHVEVKHIKVIGYGYPKTVTEFCGHLHEVYNLPVKLTFANDDGVDFLQCYDR